MRDTATIFLVSGDQAKSVMPVSRCVHCLASPPVVGMIKICFLSLLSGRKKAMVSPFGAY